MVQCVKINSFWIRTASYFSSKKAFVNGIGDTQVAAPRIFFTDV